MAVQYIALDYSMQTSTSITARIAQVDAILNSLFNVALISVGNGDTVQYSLDTGQTKIQKTFSKTSDVTGAIREYNMIRKEYVNMLTPNVVRLVDSKNFGRR